MPGGELEPVARSALAEVAAEMSEIFARAGVGQPATGLRRPAAIAALRPGRSSSPTLTWLVAAAAGVAGLGAGAFVIRTPSAPVRAEAKIERQAQLQPQVQAQVQPQPRSGPAIALAEAARAAEAAPATDLPAAKSSPVPVKAAGPPRTKSRTRAASARGPSAKPPIRLSIPTAQPASCEQDAAGDDCRSAVVQADRHLRAIYENAIRRGVPRSTLVDYRDRWSDLRDRETDNPTRLIESYGALAYDLGRERAEPDEQEDAPRGRNRSGLRALADLLLPWR